ncbi:phage major capsid protein [Marinisporobacter balticus]|uniref:HK97 family phage major capsid protein n=1 Tax=Marinisporobacter balticus TaxID=2018667 RepID=A0A4R2L552_9FIRM|nr:phage major capsid protein [Marinisporobacter balticus]TCO79129.1 hypothetical protein EV214_103181 [Marinisporobacter balticus]
MALSTVAMMDKALKEHYLPVVQDQMDNHSGPMISMIEKNTEEVEGKNIKMVLKYGRSGGVGASGETGPLPTASPRSYEHAEWGTKNIFGTIAISQKLILASKSNKGSWARQLSTQLEDTTNDCKDDFYRQIFGDGTGIITTVASATSAKTTIPVTNNIKFLREGMRIDVLASDGTPKEAGRSIIMRDKANMLIGVAGSAMTLAQGDIITVAGAYMNELTGMKAIFDNDKDLYKIPRSGDAKWFCTNIIDLAVENSGTMQELDEIRMQEAIDEADEEANSKIDYIQCGAGVARAYQYLQQSFKRNVEYMNLKGGFKAMSYNGMPLRKETYEDANVMRFLNQKDFGLFRMSDWDWMSEDGATLHRVAGTAGYEATLYFFGDLGCRKPKGQTLMKGIIEH